MHYNDGLYVAAHSYGAILNSLEKKAEAEFDYTSSFFEMTYDPEDNLEELSGGVQLSWCWGSKEKEQQYLEGELDQQLSPYVMMSLEQMIAYSINQVLDCEMRSKVGQNIVLAGGGSHLQDLVEDLEAKVAVALKELDVQDVDKVEVKTMIRDVRPISLAWVGATVLPKTESMGELWISRERWLGDLEYRDSAMEDVLEGFDGDVAQLEKKMMAMAKKEKEKEKSTEFGIKHLKEKIPFVW